MSIRTFKQTGVSYGAAPTMIIAKINGVVVHEGAIATNNTEAPTDFFGIATPDLFSWTDAAAFSGQHTMEITVVNNFLVLGPTFANYFGTSESNIAQLPGTPGAISPVYGTAENFRQLGKVASAADGSYDPLLDVTINGVLQTPPRDLYSDRRGQWRWYINTGDVFACNVNIIAAYIP